MKRLFSSTGHGAVIGITIAGTLFCILATFAVDYSYIMSLSGLARHRAILVDILLPTGLAAPLLYLFSTRIRQLNVARRELELIASTDSLTRILNRGAFTMLVDAYLEKVGNHKDTPPGSLLIVDADHFKLINDRLGHRYGDEALRLLASALQSHLRDKDLVGRIGGEEFGVFLPESGMQRTEMIAERIRAGVGEIDFRPHQERYTLSVSVGGAVYDQPTTYDELFQAADQSLYAAKKGGRNQVSIGLLSSFLTQKNDMSTVTRAFSTS